MENAVILQVKNLPYKKMPGFLKSQKINPELIAKSIFLDKSKYEPINWKNYLPFDHKVVKVILLKVSNLLLFVGYSNDGKTMIYNNSFSEMILNYGIYPETHQRILPEKESTHNKKNKIGRIDILLDKIGRFGITSLSNEEKNELDKLSKQ